MSERAKCCYLSHDGVCVCARACVRACVCVCVCNHGGGSRWWMVDEYDGV